ncbi:MAG: xanthine dehydrogenase family protein subunit M [Acidobacteriota bacterium]|nr:xanthine dehydrogenase family protein subunit M [Acidobacteriota bacterium]
MKPFVLLPVTTIADAARETAKPGSLLKAGGVDVLDRMKEGLDSPERLVSISRVPGLDRIEAGPPARIGALATLSRIESHPVLRRWYPALVDAAGGAATPQIRNMATLGGNIAQRPRCWYFRQAEFDCRKKGGDTCFAMEGENRFHAIFDTDVCCCVHPSATSVALVAYGARLETVSPGGKRTISLDEFFVTPKEDPRRENALGPGEVIESVVIPQPAPGARSAYLKLKEKESFDWPLVEACVAVTLDGGSIRDARVVLGSVSPVPRRAVAAEKVLTGARPSPELFSRAAAAAVEGATPLGQNAHKVRLARVLVERALRAALA